MLPSHVMRQKGLGFSGQDQARVLPSKMHNNMTGNSAGDREVLRKN